MFSSPLRVPLPTTATTTPPINGPQPYNSSLAFMQGNRRNLPPLQTPDRCFSSSNNKTNKPSQQTPNRSFSFSSTSASSSSSSATSNNNGIIPLLANPQPLTAPPLMKVNPTFSFSSSTPTTLETAPSRWSHNNDQQRSFHPFWCATCALDFPHQIAYQEHLRSHIPVRHLMRLFFLEIKINYTFSQCHVPGCSYTASEQLVRLHHQNVNILLLFFIWYFPRF